MAAEQDIASSQYKLGLMYEKSMGVEQSKTIARDYYLKAASQHTDTETRKLAKKVLDRL